MRTAVLLAAILVCAPAGAAVTPSGLHGVVTRGPITPVCMTGQPCTAPAKHVTLVFVHNGRIVRRVTTDASGRYRVALAPASYAVTLARRQALTRLDPVRVRVRAAHFLRLDFSIDTGIR